MCAFDLMFVGGHDLREMPLAARTTRLARLLEGVEGLHNYVAQLQTQARRYSPKP
jgi:ATP-dependent DNA ligase